MEVEKIEAEIPPTISSSSSSLTSNSSDIESVDFDELKRMPLVPPPRNHRKLLSKQLSMRETNCEAAWEKRRRHILRRTGFDQTEGSGSSKSLTNEDLDELKGSIELGFGFNEEEGQGLCDTLPALDFYFAVNRQVFDPKFRFSSLSPVSTLRGSGSSSSIGEMSSTFGSPKSPHQSESWKICSPGDNPQHVKMRLRHWAQAVACSVRQFS